MPDGMTDQEWYDQAAGILRRVVPIAPPFPTPGRRHLRSEADAGILDAAPITGGPPPEDGGTPFDFEPGGPFDPTNPQLPPDDPPGGSPFDPAGPPLDFPDDPPDGPGWHADPAGPVGPHGVDLTEQGYGANDEPESGAIVTRPDQATYTDTFDTAGPGPWWTQLKGTWLNSAGNLTVTGTGTGGVPAAIVLYNPIDYTLGKIDIVLDNVTAGAIKYALCRASDNGGQMNGYALKLNGAGAGTLALGRIDNGTFTQLGVILATTYAAGDSFGIRANGTTIEARKNGASIGTRTDATYSTGKLGIGADSTVPVFRSAALSPT